MTVHSTKKLQLIQMEDNNTTKKSLHEVEDKYIFPLWFDSLCSIVKKSWKVESLLQYMNCP